MYREVMQVYPKCITLLNFLINHSAAAYENKTTSVKLCCNNHDAFCFCSYRFLLYVCLALEQLSHLAGWQAQTKVLNA
jgi:hypothetical protein